MTRRDFILIAEALKAAKPHMSGDVTYFDSMLAWRWTAIGVRNAIATTNPEFNHERFNLASGIDGKAE